MLNLFNQFGPPLHYLPTTRSALCINKQKADWGGGRRRATNIFFDRVGLTRAGNSSVGLERTYGLRRARHGGEKGSLP